MKMCRLSVREGLECDCSALRLAWDYPDDGGLAPRQGCGNVPKVGLVRGCKPWISSRDGGCHVEKPWTEHRRAPDLMRNSGWSLYCNCSELTWFVLNKGWASVEFWDVNETCDFLLGSIRRGSAWVARNGVHHRAGDAALRESPRGCNHVEIVESMLPNFRPVGDRVVRVISVGKRAQLPNGRVVVVHLNADRVSNLHFRMPAVLWCSSSHADTLPARTTVCNTEDARPCTRP